MAPLLLYTRLNIIYTYMDSIIIHSYIPPLHKLHTYTFIIETCSSLSLNKHTGINTLQMWRKVQNLWQISIFKSQKYYITSQVANSTAISTKLHKRDASNPKVTETRSHIEPRWDASMTTIQHTEIQPPSSCKDDI